MTAAPEGLSPKVDVRNLNSVRKALRGLAGDDEDGGPSKSGGEVILGDDWVAPPGRTSRRPPARLLGLMTLQRSPLARKIVTFNLIALIILVTGMLWLAPSRDSLASQRARGLVNEAHLVAAVVEARLPEDGALDLRKSLGRSPVATFAELEFHDGAEAFLFDAQGRLAAVGRTVEASSF